MKRAQTIRLALLGFAVLLLAIVVAVEYGDRLEAINWRLVSLICMVAFVATVVYRWNASPPSQSTYDFSDLFMTGGKADLWKHLILFFAGVSAWVIIQKVLLNPREDITALLTIVLGTFVSKEILTAFADAIRGRPAAIDQSHDVNILAGAKVTPAAAVPAIPPPAPPGPPQGGGIDQHGGQPPGDSTSTPRSPSSSGGEANAEPRKTWRQP